MHWAFNWDLYGSYPEGADVFQTIDQMSTLTLFLAGLFLVCFLCSLFCEWRISRGWEPRWLETFKPGCEILEMRGSMGDHATVFVQLADGSSETYLADRAEMKELETGSVSHLWVIGKHISRIRKVGAAAPDFAVKMHGKLRLAPGSRKIDGVIVAFILLCVSVLFTGIGTRIMIVKEYAMAYGRTSYGQEPRYHLFEGSNAASLGLILLGIGVAILITLCVLWKRGWDASDLKNLDPLADWI